MSEMQVFLSVVFAKFVEKVFFTWLVVSTTFWIIVAIVSKKFSRKGDK